MSYARPWVNTALAVTSSLPSSVDRGSILSKRYEQFKLRKLLNRAQLYDDEGTGEQYVLL